MRSYSFGRRFSPLLAAAVLCSCGGGDTTAADEPPQNSPTQVVVDGISISAYVYASIYRQLSASTAPQCASSEYGVSFVTSPGVTAAQLQTLIQDVVVYRGADGAGTLPRTNPLTVIQRNSTLGIPVGGSSCVGGELASGDTIWMVIKLSGASGAVRLRSAPAKVITIS